MDTASVELVSGIYWVRLGYGEVIPIRAGVTKLHRGEQVICRTQRGIEMGEILARNELEILDVDGVGKYIRRSRPEDDLLWKQLQALSIDASVACESFLRDQELPDVLIEVEPLFDGKTLYFHFLGEPSPEIEQHVQKLAGVYQRQVASSRFAELLEHGCGPGCGTKEKSGCGSTGGGCAVCSASSKCVAK